MPDMAASLPVQATRNKPKLLDQLFLNLVKSAQASSRRGLCGAAMCTWSV